MQFILDRFSKEVKNDKMGMMAAIRKDSRAISLASPVLQKDRRDGSTGSSTSDGWDQLTKETGDGTGQRYVNQRLKFTVKVMKDYRNNR